MEEATKATKADGLTVELSRDVTGDVFGAVIVKKRGSSLTMNAWRFNITTDETGEIPLGIERPRHADKPPARIWKIAAEFFAELEKGEDY